MTKSKDLRCTFPRAPTGLQGTTRVRPGRANPSCDLVAAQRNPRRNHVHAAGGRALPFSFISFSPSRPSLWWAAHGGRRRRAVVHHERQEGRVAAGRGEDSSGQHGRRRWEPAASGAQAGGDSGSATDG
uniref:Uncharacterized protein n=1 Tax=Oryza rufipogon TaxID=4529 RepID=A0A0E0NPG3_ORYRU